ncbi:hypothetical protein GY45DRAFT_1318644 [Cubamyces sp. BRFM 1775]|nr:hypothetical protein GY45DRAFT_1318644 [Cubamyces sp. BRFM 1775]
MTVTSPLHVLEDSGVPTDSADYTTLVIIHGYAWHSGTFIKLLPLAAKYNTRILLVNRRDYPGSEPYSEAERASLPPISLLAGTGTAADEAAALANLKAFMKERARELYDLLVQLVKNEDITAADRKNNKGGIVVAGWSFGSSWMTALLANVAAFPVEDIKLSDHIRRVVLLDPPHHSLGYPVPDDPYNPLFDESIPVEDRGSAFATWVSGYYIHGDSPDKLERRTPLRDPPSTLSTFTPEEVQQMLCSPPGAPGGSDMVVMNIGIKVGLYDALRKEALYLPAGGPAESGNIWEDVEVRYVSCEHSVWEMPWGTMSLQRELEAARTQSLPMRNVRLVFVKGTNHFVQWDKPERALHALVGDEDVVQ